MTEFASDGPMSKSVAILLSVSPFFTWRAGRGGDCSLLLWRVAGPMAPCLARQAALGVCCFARFHQQDVETSRPKIKYSAGAQHAVPLARLVAPLAATVYVTPR